MYISKLILLFCDAKLPFSAILRVFFGNQYTIYITCDALEISSRLYFSLHIMLLIYSVIF